MTSINRRNEPEHQWPHDWTTTSLDAIVVSLVGVDDSIIGIEWKPWGFELLLLIMPSDESIEIEFGIERVCCCWRCSW